MVKKRNFYIGKIILHGKTRFMQKKKAPAALGPAQKNAVLKLKTHFISKNAFYKKIKNACGIKTGFKKRSFDIKNAFYTDKRIL